VGHALEPSIYLDSVVDRRINPFPMASSSAAAAPSPKRGPLTFGSHSKRSDTQAETVELVFADEGDELDPDIFGLCLLSLNTFYKAARQVLHSVSDDDFFSQKDVLVEKVRQKLKADFVTNGQLTFDVDIEGFEILSLRYGSKLSMITKGRVIFLMAVAMLTGGEVDFNKDGVQVKFGRVLPTWKQTQEVVGTHHSGKASAPNPSNPTAESGT